MTPLEGKVVAITGGAGGISSDVARALARGGARIAIGDIDADAAHAVAKNLPTPGGDHLGLPIDVTDAESTANFLARAEEALGPVDILILGAGVMWVGRYDAEPDEVTDAQVGVNLLGVIRGVKAAAPTMARRGGGHIIAIASAASVLSPPGEATYAATKHGVLGYLKAVREELRGTGVKISAIMPGVVDTELAVGTATGAAKLLAPREVTKAVVRTIAVPKFQVTVPGFVGPLNAVIGLLPEPVQDLMYRLMVPNQVKRADPRAREEYESRIRR